MILVREEINLHKRTYLFNKTLIIGIIILLLFVNVSAYIGNSIGNDSGISLITIKATGGIGGIENWYGNDNNFNFTYESDEISEIYCGIDGNFSLYNETFNVPGRGEHILEWYSVNHTGNKSEIDGPFTFKVDKTPPDISFFYDIVSGNPIQGWNFEFIANAVDSMSGMDHVEFYFNHVLQEIVTGPGPEYVWTLRYWPIPRAIFYATAYDKAGNSDSDEIIDHTIYSFESTIFKNNNDGERSNNCCLDFVFPSETTERENHGIANRIPSGTLNRKMFNPAYVLVEFNRDYGENDWIVDEVSIPILYESDRVDEIYYKINNTGWKLYTYPIKISKDGIYDFSWFVVDLEGCSSTPDSIPRFKVDLTPPEMNLTQERLNINKVKFKAEVTDKTSGIEKVRFKSSLRWFIDYDYPYEWIWYGLLRDKIIVTVYDYAGNVNIQSMTTSRNHNQNHHTLKLMFFRFLEKFSFIEKLYSLLI